MSRCAHCSAPLPIPSPVPGVGATDFCSVACEDIALRELHDALDEEEYIREKAGRVAVPYRTLYIPTLGRFARLRGVRA